MAKSLSVQTTPTKQQVYIPGACNIGRAERAKRRQVGIIATVATLVLLALLIITNAPRAWRLLLILPASAAASGYLQDGFHFCAGFGMKGLYNIVNSAGITDDVTSEEFRRKDRRKALVIISFSVVFGIVVAGLSLLLRRRY